MSSQTASLGLKLQARAIAGQIADSKTSRWVVGTNALREENEIQLLQYEAERDNVSIKRTLGIDGEVWCIAPSPADPNQIAVVTNKGGTYTAAIVRLPQEEAHVQQEADLKGHEGTIHKVMWHPRNAQLLATIEDASLRIWSLTDGAVKETAKASAGASYSFAAGSLKTRDESCCCTSGGSGIQVWDLRSMKQSASKEAAHTAGIRDLDFAHQADHLLASCGEDCRVKVWDLRSFSRPVTEVASHAHWVWQVRFNPEHDQLLLTSSSDSFVNLLHLPSLAARLPTEQPKYSSRNNAAKDGCAASFDMHEDSVHGIAWSAADPWTFASLSYDGRIAVSKVPSSVKYKVLI